MLRVLRVLRLLITYSKPGRIHVSVSTWASVLCAGWNDLRMFPRSFGMVRISQCAGGDSNLLIRQLVARVSRDPSPLNQKCAFLDFVRLERKIGGDGEAGIGGMAIGKGPRLDPRLPRISGMRAAARCCRVSPVQVGWVALISRSRPNSLLELELKRLALHRSMARAQTLGRDARPCRPRSCRRRLDAPSRRCACGGAPPLCFHAATIMAAIRAIPT